MNSTSTTADLPLLVSADRLADHFGVSKRTVLNWAKQGRLPAPRRFGKSRYWLRDTIESVLCGQ